MRRDPEHFLGARHARFGARLVEVFRPLGHLRQHRHRVRQHLDETHRHQQEVLLAPCWYHIVPVRSPVKNGVWPGSTPKSPSMPGRET